MISGILALGFAGSRCEASAPAGQATILPAQAALTVQGRSGTVIETMDSGGYTYVHVDTGSEQIWAAAPEFVVRNGDSVVVPDGMAMKDFTSKSLNRTFEEVLFVGEVMVSGTDGSGSLPQGHPATSSVVGAHSRPVVTAPDIDLSGLEKAAQSVEEIFAGKEALAGGEVSVRGKVVKFSQQIMKTNWLHVQDGTGGEGTNDLVVTTDAVVAKGDTVLVTGVLTVNKDFGFGYKYDVIVEGAQVTVE